MKIFISFLFFITLSFLVIIYVNISKPQISFNNNQYLKKIEKLKKEQIKTPIIYNFPAKIMAMHIDFRNYKYVYVYKVIVNINDRFELFNIKTILKNNNLIYSLVENKNKSKIYILFRNLDEATKVLNLFKEYNFKVKIQKIKQRI
ncbi:hypothetical protein [Caminibacter mediatlanticus]|uniref:30S ribosomal protein S1 n=1 Tax=Caminibacter mediatlanticus TB-2 TaxID=391592 RepID=A0AAI9AH76_9BACT|nr:hypothetical protein [Caminibacter mediatlanticus]EDM24146.1 30S ribosomal protein S1 [Caminibacter mediatlanticus TB-2]